MRSFSLLAIAWIIIAFASWIIGRSIFRERDDNQQIRRFARDASIVEQLLSVHTWPPTPDASAKWTEIETTMEVDVLPTLRNNSPRDQASPHADDASAPTSGPQAWTSVSRIGDRMVTSKNLRLRIERQSGSGNDAAEDFERFATPVQLTRPVRPASLGAWNALCLTLGVTGLGIIGGVALRWRWHQRHIHEEISPWVLAVQKRPPASPIQLGNLAGPSDLATNLNMVAEKVNYSLASLYQSVQRNELVLRNLREGVLAVDDNSRVILANRTLDEHVTVAADNYLLRPMLEVVRAPQMHDFVQSVLGTGSPREEVVQIHQTSKWLRITARPLPIGDRIGVLVTTRDESLLKRIEAIRKDFIANASHELKTPLAAIRAYAETLQLGALDDRDAAENFLSNIIGQVDRIDGLVQGMLQLSRVESGSGMRIETFSSIKALEPCLAAAGAVARTKDIELVVDCEDGCVIESDINGFQTIASNLLSNAVRYTHTNGTVSLTVRKITAGGQGAIEMTVEDSGIGITPEDLERIFERFYRAEKDRSTETGGTGLGLSIVKHLTTALGGTVSATSQPGKGSVFQVILPAKSSGAFLT
jgi:two-component system phosphate regulon sensor histidine kinase PhoR